MADLVEPVTCDFNFDQLCDAVDLDNLGTDIIAGTNAPEFDLNSDGVVDLTDQDIWKDLAATANGFAEPYLDGDANLDGVVNAADLNVVGTNWLSNSNVNPWTHGDSNADGSTNASDLNLLGISWHKQVASAASEGRAVPEPSAAILLLSAALASLLVRRRYSA